MITDRLARGLVIPHTFLVDGWPLGPARGCPGSTLADVYAALAYYFDHRAEIEAHFRRDEALAAAIRPRFPSKLREELGG